MSRKRQHSAPKKVPPPAAPQPPAAPAEVFGWDLGSADPTDQVGIKLALEREKMALERERLVHERERLSLERDRWESSRRSPSNQQNFILAHATHILLVIASSVLGFCIGYIAKKQPTIELDARRVDASMFMAGENMVDGQELKAYLLMVK